MPRRRGTRPSSLSKRSRNVKIAVLADAQSIHSWRWVRFFADREHEVHWISLHRFEAPGPAAVQRYEVGTYPTGAFTLLRAALRVRALLRRIRPELLHIHSVGTYGFVGWFSRFHPAIVTPWGSDVLLGARSRLKRPFIRAALNRADRITCDAYHMREAMAKLGVDVAKISIIFFGTDTVRFHPQLDGRGMRTRFGVGEAPVVISTRALEPLYNVESLVRAIALVVREFPHAKCLIVGRGPERAGLEALARELGVAHSVQFVGAVTADEMPGCLAAADIYVSTSLSDAGLAASTAEAMACGLPSVVTDSAENRTWVEEGRGGFVVPVRNPGALAEKILYLATRPEVRRRFGAHNRRVIEERNNFDVEMGKIEQLYASVVAEFARP